MFLVYGIRNSVDGKLYVGVTTCSLAKRWREHRCAANTGSEAVLYRAMRFHGESQFSITILYEATSKEEMLAVERGLIAQYGTQSRRLGYNLTAGGDSGSGVRLIGALNARSKLTETIVRYIRDPAKSTVCNADMRDEVRTVFGVAVSRDAIRDARRGDCWTHLNAEAPPIRVGQGNRPSARRTAASRAVLQLPQVRSAVAAANSLRMRGQRIAAKLTPEQARAIFLDERSHRAIGREYRMSHGIIGRIKSGRSWAAETKDLRHA